MKKMVVYKVIFFLSILVFVVHGKVPHNADDLRQQSCVVTKNKTCNLLSLYQCEANIDDLQKECDDENSHACMCSAIQAEELGNAEIAKAQYELLCDKGETKGCYALGNLYRLQHIEHQNYFDAKKAVALYKKACDNNIYAACHMLSEIFWSRAQGAGFLVDMGTSDINDILWNNCHKGYILSCDALAKYFRTQMYYASDGYKSIYLKSYGNDHDKKNMRNALKSFRYHRDESDRVMAKLCDDYHDLNSCNQLANSLISGNSDIKSTILARTKVDHKKGIDYYNKSCGYDNYDACLRLCEIYGENLVVVPNFIKAETYCDQASQSYLAEKNDMRTQDAFNLLYKRAAQSLLQKSCELGDENACEQVKLMKRLQYAPQITVQYFY